MGGSSSWGFRSVALLRLAPVMLLLIVAAVYLQSLGNGFVYDDKFFIADNAGLAEKGNFLKILTNPDTFGTEDQNPYYRPITTLSFYINQQTTPNDAFWFHLTSLFLHLGNCWLLYLILKRYATAVWAFMGALYFGVHPINVEAISYISARADLLCALFILGSYVAWLKADEGDNRNFLGLSLFLYLLGCFSKATALMFPAALASQGFINGEFRKRLGALALYLIPAAFFLISRSVFVQISSWAPFDPVSNLATGGVNIIRSIIVSLLPIKQSPLYGREPYTTFLDCTVLTCWATLIMLCFLAYRFRGSQKSAIFGLSWYLIMLFPASGIPILLFPSFVADRYMYLPIAGLALALANLLGQGKLDRQLLSARVAATSLLLSVYAITSNQWTGTWKNDLTYWRRAVKVQPTDPMALGALGTMELKNQNKAEAIRAYKSAILSGSRNPRDFSNLSVLLVEAGQVQSAVTKLEEGMKIAEDDWLLHSNYAKLLATYGQLEKSQEHEQRAKILKEKSGNSIRNQYVVKYRIED